MAGLLLAGLALPGAAQERPLSAIDWLEQNPPSESGLSSPDGSRGGTGSRGNHMPPTDEPPVSNTADSPDITVTQLGESGDGGVGLLPSSVTGFPRDLWQGSSPAKLSRLLESVEVEPLPAMQSLLYTLLLAEAQPPGGPAEGEDLLLTRIDRLTSLGAVEPAEALVVRTGPDTPALFRRYFDLSLLVGRQDSVCQDLMANPHLIEDYAPRIYCQALSGDWTVAATMLEGASAVGALSPSEAGLLTRFLDPEMGADLPLAPPSRPSPLEYRLLEAIGEAPPAAILPRPFSVIELSGDAGWKAQIEAAERLARMGAVSENRLIGIYTERDPAASGGVWDRVEAVQSFDDALRAGDDAKIAETLRVAWATMRDSGLAVPFAKLFGEALLTTGLEGQAASTAREVILLSNDYEQAGDAFGGVEDRRGRFLASIARGAPEPELARSGMERAVAEGFGPAEMPEDQRRKLDEGRLGEVILEAMARFAAGAEGDLRDVAQALATLREVGLEDTARRAALQLLLLTGQS